MSATVVVAQVRSVVVDLLLLPGMPDAQRRDVLPAEGDPSGPNPAG
jgi:hypothetical protein